MAVITFLGTTVSNWGSTSSWSTGTIPTLGDLVIFTSSSATCSLNVTGTCSQIDFTNYNKQFRFNANGLGVYGTISFGPNMGYSFSAASYFPAYNLAQRGTGAIITNGATVGVPFILYGDGVNTTHTITGQLNMSENFSVSAGAGGITQTINGTTISCSKSLQFNNQGGNSSANGTTGSVSYIMIGTGTLAYSGGSNGGLTTPNLIINSTGTITLSGNVYVRNLTINWISGNSVGLFNFLFNGPGTFTNTPYNSGTYSQFGIGTGNATGVVTLTNDLYTINRVNTLGGQFNGGNIYTMGGINNITSLLSGSSILTITGTGSGSSATLTTTTNYALNTVINTPGILTIGYLGWSPLANGYFTYTAGNVSVTGNTLISGSNNCSLTMPSSKFGLVSLGSNNQTISLLSNWNMTTFNISNANLTFTGSNGWTTDVFTNTGIAGNNTLTLREGLTYSVIKQFSISPAAYSQPFYIQSGASGSYTNLYIAPGATQTTYSISLRDVNNVGTPMWIYNPTLINSTNVWTLNWQSVQETTISGF